MINDGQRVPLISSISASVFLRIAFLLYLFSKLLRRVLWLRWYVGAFDSLNETAVFEACCIISFSRSSDGFESPDYLITTDLRSGFSFMFT